jgi:hypothetical protein
MEIFFKKINVLVLDLMYNFAVLYMASNGDNFLYKRFSSRTIL